MEINYIYNLKQLSFSIFNISSYVSFQFLDFYLLLYFAFILNCLFRKVKVNFKFH